MASGTFAKRLKEARKMSELSQKELGIRAGLDEFSASTRMNRYEQGVHEPDHATARHIADALGVPTAFLYAEEDELAELIRLFGELTKQDRKALIITLRELAQQAAQAQ